ncbi:hypothetical protein J3459_017591 [Metarhizium acridum]|uniref:uncharacterized protein n=1 Tax=Metarhizium acridum TaxID=92637 RepID=UPI001C6CD972|nr:hypothetical protein J3459_017591 [Metarhizium acridum]KAG8418492.1 hypothetical protein J3458_005901 [Metarhizium acridum]
MGTEFSPIESLEQAGPSAGCTRENVTWSFNVGRICLAADAIMPSSSEHHVAKSGKNTGKTHHPSTEEKRRDVKRPHSRLLHVRHSRQFPDTYVEIAESCFYLRVRGRGLFWSLSYDDDASRTARGHHGLRLRGPVMFAVLQFRRLLCCTTASLDVISAWCLAPYSHISRVGLGATRGRGMI